MIHVMLIFGIVLLFILSCLLVLKIFKSLKKRGTIGAIVSTVFQKEYVPSEEEEEE